PTAVAAAFAANQPASVSTTFASAEPAAVATSEPAAVATSEPTTVATTSPTAQPAAGPAAEPATPAVDPATISAAAPATEPATEPAAISAAVSATEPATEPAAITATESNAQSASKPAAITLLAIASTIGVIWIHCRCKAEQYKTLREEPQREHSRCANAARLHTVWRALETGGHVFSADTLRFGATPLAGANVKVKSTVLLLAVGLSAAAGLIAQLLVRLTFGRAELRVRRLRRGGLVGGAAMPPLTSLRSDDHVVPFARGTSFGARLLLHRYLRAWSVVAGVGVDSVRFGGLPGGQSKEAWSQPKAPPSRQRTPLEWRFLAALSLVAFRVWSVVAWVFPLLLVGGSQIYMWAQRELLLLIFREWIAASATALQAATNLAAEKLAAEKKARSVAANAENREKQLAANAAGAAAKAAKAKEAKEAEAKVPTAAAMVEAKATTAMSVPKPATRSTDTATAQQLNRRTQRATRPHPIPDAKANAAPAPPPKQPTLGRKRKPEALLVVSKSNPWTIAGGSTSALNDNVGAISAGGSAERKAGGAGKGAGDSSERAAGGAGEGAGGNALIERELAAGSAGEGAGGSALNEREPVAGGTGEGAGGSAERAAGNAGSSAFEDWRSLKGATLQAIAEQAQQLRIVIEEAGAEQRRLFALQMHEQEQRMQARFDSERRSIATEFETLRDARTLASTHNWLAMLATGKYICLVCTSHFHLTPSGVCSPA
ncbi:hypothetical protein T492DRAFT_856753, partial [Pavlovales sp. CCMP2436]